MSKAVSGRDGTVKSNGNDMNVMKFDINVKVGDVDTSTTGDAGWVDSIDGPKEVDGSFDFLYDPTNSPFSALAGLLPGSGTYPTLTLQATTGQVFTGVARVKQLSLKSEYKGTKTFTATFVGKQAWTMPS